ncbi:hypothetical protein Tco_0304183 [Tanacetum coccineum]
MASMKYCDKHNQVGFLKKPEESAGFCRIVDFLKGSHIRNMKRGFRGVPRPLLPAMLPVVVVDQSAGPADQAEDQPSSSAPLPSSSHPPVISAIIASKPTPETEVPQSQDPTHPHVPEARTMTVEDLLHLVPNLITKVYSLETKLKQTKLTMGNAIVKLVKKVKNMEDILKRRHVIFTDLEDEEPEDQGRIIQDIDDDPLGSKGDFRSKSVDKGKRYKRRKEFKGKYIDSGFEEVNTGFEKVNTGGLGVSIGSGPVSSARGQREGKAPMIVEETQAPKRTKEQIQQEEASLAEAIRLQTLEEEETAKQVHLDALLAKRIEEEELTEQQKQRKAQNVLGKELPEEDFSKKMVELVNQRKKFFAEERAKARRSKPMTQSQLRNYMMNYLKNQRTWKLTQLKKLSFEEKQKAKKGINVDKSPQGESETDEEESVEAMNPTPLDTKSNIVANWKIFQQGERSIYQIIRANGADTVYMSFGAMLKDFNEDAIWSLPLQQKIISWSKLVLKSDELSVAGVMLETVDYNGREKGLSVGKPPHNKWSSITLFTSQRSINAPGRTGNATIIEYEVGDVLEILPRQSSKAINHYTLQSEPSINLNTPHTPAKGGGAAGRPKGGKNKTAPHMSVSNTDEAC